jgi:hypothetical protein
LRRLVSVRRDSKAAAGNAITSAETGEGGTVADDFVDVYLEHAAGLIPVAAIPRDENAAPGDRIAIIFRDAPITLEIIEVVRHHATIPGMREPPRLSLIARRR